MLKAAGVRLAEACLNVPPHVFQRCVDKLTEACSPSLDTIKMQVYFDMNYTPRREYELILILCGVIVMFLIYLFNFIDFFLYNATQVFSFQCDITHVHD